MSKELNELRSQGLKPGATSTTSTDDSGFSADATGHHPSAIPGDEFDLSVETVEIGCIVLPASSAIEAFKIFATFFHPKFPILVSISINTIYHSSPFLFWTIIVIVAAHAVIPSSEALFTQLLEPFQDMVKTEALQAPLPLQKIRALLLLCVWSLPVDAQRHDPSWLYSGIAVNSGLFLGLHRPNSPPSTRGAGAYPGTPLERITTWLGCFYVGGSLSMHLGLPVLVDSSSELARVTACLQEYPIPREFAGEIKLQAIIADFTNVLSHTANDGAVDSSILHLLDRELETLKSSYPDQWPSMLEYSTLVAKLHMYGLVISRDRVGSTARDILLKLSFSTCLRIIYLANMRYNENPPNSHGVTALRQLRSLPKSYFRALAFTTAFLLRYFGLNTTASAEEQQLAANHVVLSHTIFKSCSFHPTDELGRVAKIFEELCQHGPMTIDSQHVAPGDRVGVQILVNTMRSALRKRGGDTTSNAEPLAPPATQSISPDLNLNSFGDFGASMNQALDSWSVDMIFSGQYWDESTWDALDLSCMDTQFPQG
ncbi:putative transcription factor [Rosellinia necatrix]|uniref:Putative transcription factor n=1 Tax=Rosellinia necatrix TaxID=77044 RepID=A0A1W2TF25_ROSNE|nr:putative transcription factor [Rosellinia necatrix]